MGGMGRDGIIVKRDKRYLLLVYNILYRSLYTSTCICTHLVTSHGHVVIISQVIPEMRYDQCKLFLCVIVLEMQFINLENYPPYGINHGNGAVFN